MKTFIAFVITVAAFVGVFLLAEYAPALLGTLGLLLAFVLVWSVVRESLN